MHGYFLSLQLYDTARLIANPYVYEEHRARVVQEKLDSMAETRIRARKDVGVKVNKALAEKVRKEEERERKRAERKASRKAKAAGVEGAAAGVDADAMDVDAAEQGEEHQEPVTLLNDPRFKALFENPEFQVDETTREFALLNPSTAAQRQSNGQADGKARRKTAVEEEEEESDNASSDGLSDESEDDDKSKSGSESEDSDEAGGTLPVRLSALRISLKYGLLELWHDNIQARIAARDSGLKKAREARNARKSNVRLVPMRAHSDVNGERGFDRNASFGQRRSATVPKGKGKGRMLDNEERTIKINAEGGVEMTYVPSGNRSDGDGGRGEQGLKNARAGRRKGAETFGAGMERGGEDPEVNLTESERMGRTHRRKGMRSGSKNVFRRM